MLTGTQFRSVRRRLGLSWKETAEGLHCSVRTIARWEASGALSRRISLKAQRVFYAAAKLRANQDLCPTCHMGFVPKPGAAATLPQISGLRGDGLPPKA